MPAEMHHRDGQPDCELPRNRRLDVGVLVLGILRCRPVFEIRFVVRRPYRAVVLGLSSSSPSVDMMSKRLLQPRIVHRQQRTRLEVRGKQRQENAADRDRQREIQQRHAEAVRGIPATRASSNPRCGRPQPRGDGRSRLQSRLMSRDSNSAYGTRSAAR